MRTQFSIVRAGSACPLFTAALMLALALTFGCSGDSNDGTSVKKEQISGVSQKGPFMRGSTAVLYELDDKLVQTGRSFRDIIADDKGSFDIKINVELVSPYAMLEVDGYYRNEVTGNPSAGAIKLYAIADIREKSNVNVNILTHLEYYRVQKLVEEGKSLEVAKKQAQKEILAVFGISGDFKNSEDMSIFGTSDADAALLAISILLQGDLSEAQFVERLTDFRLGFKETGAWNSNAAKQALADWATKADLGSIRSKILGWNLSSSVPDFEKFVNNYWQNYWLTYSLGACDAENDGELKSYKYSSAIYSCKNNVWVEVKYIDGKCYKSKSCLTFTDPRDNQSYVYVVIGEQTWMAENLNYIPGSKCWIEDDEDYVNGVKVVDWDIDVPDCTSGYYDLATALNVCPSGWHLPSHEEWQELVDFAGGYEIAAAKLKATIGWNDWNGGVGTDDYGFAALPYAYWWSTGEEGFNCRQVERNAYGCFVGEGSLLNVRCLKD